MNSNNNQNTIELSEADTDYLDYRQDCTFSEDTREEEMFDIRSMMMEDQQRIFRDLPDADYTPIETSNDSQRIPLSPAWSQESMEDPEELKPSMAIDASNAPSQQQQLYYLNGPSSNFVARISDFDLNSGTIQRLNF
ncbi:unnamed protein product [Cylindrotheca closterium]|uniref:Uncharacterized protein n=1 Tax=Cylindrotheca closterium TaxID=2856 RepID=A0AAD2PWR7_9STRA|nr:unnamed protein product [Cylindrotheca closterium]